MENRRSHLFASLQLLHEQQGSLTFDVPRGTLSPGLEMELSPAHVCLVFAWLRPHHLRAILKWSNAHWAGESWACFSGSQTFPGHPVGSRGKGLARVEWDHGWAYLICRSSLAYNQASDFTMVTKGVLVWGSMWMTGGCNGICHKTMGYSLMLRS